LDGLTYSLVADWLSLGWAIAANPAVSPSSRALYPSH